MPYVEVEPGVHLFVQDIHPAGERTVLFIHGWPLDHTTFEYQYDVLPSHGIRCIGMDLRGFGLSDKPWEGYSYDRLADDVRAVVDALGLQEFTLAGHSMGGAIAIRYMARHGGHSVGRLALMAAAAPSFTPRPGSPYGMSMDQVDGFIKGLYKDRPQVLVNFSMMFFGRPVTPAFMQWFQLGGLGAAGYSTIQTLESLRDEDLSSDLAAIRVPTGIFAGVLDQVCPYPFAVELNKGIAGSTLFRFDYSGHAVYYDQLDRFNQLFLQFIEA